MAMAMAYTALSRFFSDTSIRLFMLFLLTDLASARDALLILSENTSTTENVNPAFHYQLTDRDETFDLLPKQETAWTGSNNNVPINLGFNRHALWLRTHLRNDSRHTQQRLLEIHYPVLDGVDFWCVNVDGQILSHDASGDRRPLSQRQFAYRYPLMRIELAAHEEQDVYIRVVTDGSLQVPLRLHDTWQFWTQVQRDDLAVYAYIGSVIALASFNLFLFFSLRDRSYLYYVFYIVGIAMIVMTLNGLTYQWLWPESPWWANVCLPIFQCITIFTYGLFSETFLKSPGKLLRSNRILRLLCRSALIMSLLAFYDYGLATQFISVFAIIIGLAYLAMAIWLWFKTAHASAKYYVIAWLPFIVALVILTLYFHGDAITHISALELILLASAGEMVLLALALAARVRRLQGENERMHRDSESDLVKQVAVRTLELTQANQQLASTNKDMEFFAYAMAHDLKAPLRAIIGYSEHLHDSVASHLDDDDQQLFTRLRSCATQLRERIEAIVALAQLSAIPLHYQEINLTAMAAEVIEELRAADPERKAGVDIEQGLTVLGDFNLLRIVMQNMIENAWKYSGKRDCANIAVGSKAHDDGICFFVRDNGAGFDMRHSKNLFRPFQRLHSATEFAGSGIGLANSAKIIERHHGHIWAESEIDKGTTLYFSLPNTQP